MSSGKKKTFNFRLPSAQVDWLKRMAESHELPDISKAARCCINCAALGDVSPESFGAIHDDMEEMIELDIDLGEEQIAWLMGKASGEDKEEISNALIHVITASMSADEQTVFGVVRCKLKINECEGAQEAVNRVEEKFGTVQVQEEVWKSK